MPSQIDDDATRRQPALTTDDDVARQLIVAVRNLLDLVPLPAIPQSRAEAELAAETAAKLNRARAILVLAEGRWPTSGPS